MRFLIFKVEEARKLARKLKAKIPADSNGPLALVLIPNQDDGGWTRVSTATEVEAAILQQNQRAFHALSFIPQSKRI